MDRLERYDWEDEMRLGISRMNEFDRGYYIDNPYCYVWEIDQIPFDEEYYENLEDFDSDDEN